LRKFSRGDSSEGGGRGDHCADDQLYVCFTPPIDGGAQRGKYAKKYK